MLDENTVTPEVQAAEIELSREILARKRPESVLPAILRAAGVDDDLTPSPVDERFHQLVTVPMVQALNAQMAKDVASQIVEAQMTEDDTQVSQVPPAPPTENRIFLAPGVFATVKDCLEARDRKHHRCGGKGWRKVGGERLLCDCGIDRLKAKVARSLAPVTAPDRKNTPIVSSEERERESARRRIQGWQAEIAELRGKMQERSIRNAEMVASLEWDAIGEDESAKSADRNAEACKTAIADREEEIRRLEDLIATARSEIVGLAKDREKFIASAAEHRKQAEHHRSQVEPTKRKLPKSNEGALAQITALERQVALKLAKHTELRNGSAPLPTVASVDEAATLGGSAA